MPYTYAYPRPAVTADCLIFRKMEEQWEILLIRRARPPFEGMWALPGGFMDMDETLEQAAIRELKEETGLEGIPLEQFRTYSGLDRDPRQRTVGVTFWGVHRSGSVATAGDDAREVAWFRINALPPLAFDHSLIVGQALETLALPG